MLSALANCPTMRLMAVQNKAVETIAILGPRNRKITRC